MMETLLNLRAEALAIVVKLVICAMLVATGWVASDYYYQAERAKANQAAVEKAAKLEKDADRAKEQITASGDLAVRTIEENLVVKERRNEELYLANDRLMSALLGLRDTGTADTVRPYQLSFTTPTACPVAKPTPRCESARRIAAAAPERARRADDAIVYSQACYEYTSKALAEYRNQLIEFNKKYGGG